jgi:hypothetical protein
MAPFVRFTDSERRAPCAPTACTPHTDGMRPYADGMHPVRSNGFVGHVLVRGRRRVIRGRGRTLARTAVQLAPDPLADALRVPAPAVGETVDERQARPLVSSPSGHRGRGGRALVSATSRRTVAADSPTAPGSDRRSTAGQPVCTTALVTSSETSRISVSASGSSTPIPDRASLERAHLRARPTSVGSGRISSCT